MRLIVKLLSLKCNIFCLSEVFEIEAKLVLKSLIKNQSIVIMLLDKGNSLERLDTVAYTSNTKAILNVLNAEDELTCWNHPETPLGHLVNNDMFALEKAKKPRSHGPKFSKSAQHADFAKVLWTPDG